MPTESPPTNDVLFDTLSKAIWDDQCIAIIGAGVSAKDYPPWNRLVAALQDRCRVRTEDSKSTHPLDVLEAAKEKDPDEYFRVLDNIFGRRTNPSSASRYHMLARINFRSYVTLNFDPLLLDTMDLHRNVTVSEYPTLKNQHHGSGELFYLHGRLGPDRPAAKSRIVLTRSEFRQAYDPFKERLHSFLQQTMLDHNVCFIGCNPAETHLAYLLKACKKFCQTEHGLNDPARPKWFLLSHGEGASPPDLHECGISVVSYPMGDQNYSGLDHVLQYWAKKAEPKVRPAGVEPSPFRPDVEPET